MICERAKPQCGSVLANVAGRITCLVCAEPHKVSPWYSPLGYALKGKAQREAHIRAGFCAECGRRRDTLRSSRLCSVHLAKKAERKRRYNERRNSAIRNSLHRDAGTGYAGGRVLTYDLRDETAEITL